MTNQPINPLSQSLPINPEAELLAGMVRAGLNRRGTTPAEAEVMRLVRALTRLQPAALVALSSSPPTNGQSSAPEKGGSTTASPEDAFSATLQSLAI